jgi:hypothetical protein
MRALARALVVAGAALLLFVFALEGFCVYFYAESGDEEVMHIAASGVPFPLLTAAACILSGLWWLNTDERLERE